MSKYPTFNGLMQNSSNLKPLKTQRRNCCQRFTPNFQDQLWLNCTENTRWIMTYLVLTLTKFYIWLVIFLWLKMKKILNQNTFSRFMCEILRPDTPPNSEIICGQNVSTKVVCGIFLFFEKKAMLKIWKKSWVPFRTYLLNSTANPAHLHSNWTGLAELYNR